jgi:hypothetical protein
VLRVLGIDSFMFAMEAKNTTMHVMHAIEPYPGHQPFEKGNELWTLNLAFIIICLQIIVVAIAVRTYARALRKMWNLEDCKY